MGILTPFFNLFKPAKTDPQAISKINEDLDIIDTEMHKPPLSVNGIFPDSTTRDLYVETVPLAQNLATDDAMLSTGTIIERASGGGLSISDGQAFLSTIKGNCTHTGVVAESITMTVTPAEREEGEDPITATIDRDTFVSYVADSGTITLTYTTAWSADPANYGITVSGTPINGDIITVVYVKENRGTINVANPSTFNSTGWNLYNNTDGYAKVVKYSTEYGYKIGGTYSLVEFATTVAGTRTTLTIEDGYFTIPADGYVFVTGGNNTTYIYATWSDWTDTYEGTFQTYTVDTIDLSEVMLNFPNGLLSVGVTRDEINLNTQTAISRIERMAYTAENLAAVIALGVDYDADTNYIYAVRVTPTTTAIELDGEYTVSDHGIEFFTGTTIPVYTECLYGENLKDYLRHDVPVALSSLNTAIGNIDPKRGDLNTISSDTTLIALDAGTYQVVLSSGTPVTNGYIPAQYGTLIVNDSGKNYKSYTFVTTGNAVYSRICHKGNSTWYTAWQQLAPKNETVATYSTSGNTDANVAKIWKIYDANLGYCLIVETRDGVQKKIKFDA